MDVYGELFWKSEIEVSPEQVAVSGYTAAFVFSPPIDPKRVPFES